MTVSPLHFQEPILTIKLLLLGESSVGKTSLASRAIGLAFEPNGTLLTIGVQVKKIIRHSQGKKIRLELWDTAGQQKYRTLPSQYFRGIQGIMVVYDITNMESFDRVKDWLAKIQQNCVLQKLVLTLIGNKVDLQQLREVNPEQAMAYAMKMKMGFKETSAKTAVNVEETINEMLSEIIKQGLYESKKGVVLELQMKSRKDVDSCCG